MAQTRADKELRALALNSASSCYSDLAKLETTRDARRQRLDAAVEAIEEAIHIRRDLGLHGELATSLSKASVRFSERAGAAATPEGRRKWLRKAVDTAEESVRVQRPLGVPVSFGISLFTTAVRCQVFKPNRYCEL